ncbi:DUF6531 domain-containing protein, partial [Roseimaritima sediminicola]|uniref:DUF6531 domain-containing protein n=1 Tax=Roseimaritima sediminicola TaxID=2662066 RepID=UPI00192A244F
MPPEEETCEANEGGIDPYSFYPVRYATGELQLFETDLQVPGAGGPWVQRRQYSNQLRGPNNVGLGCNWLVEAWPYLTKDADGAVCFVRSSRNALWFDESAGNYIARFGAKSTLTLDSANDRLVLSQPTGEVWYFRAFGALSSSSSSSSSGSGSALPGMLLGMIDAMGQATDVVGYTGDGRIETIERESTVDGQTVSTQFHYEYTGGQTTSVTYRRQVGTGAWNDIRRATYEYYDGTTEHGSAGDLMRVRVQEPSGITWNNVRQSYYRYYKDATAGGFKHGLRFVVQPDGYADMLADSLDPTTVSNAVLLQYARYNFQYGSDRRVTQEIVDRGSITVGYSYFTSSNTDTYNHWKTRAIETRPDGATRTVYSNYIGQPLLSELKSGSDVWLQADSYDSEAHRIQSAGPSAVASYDANDADLNVQLNASSGLVRIRSYYATTNIPTGAAKGFLESTSLKQGSSGTPILQSHTEYTSRTAGAVTIYPASKQTQYQNDDGSGSLTTQFDYTWHDGTVQPKQQTVTLPVVTTSENGSGAATSTKTVFDTYGNPVWTMDARGFITYSV